MNTYLERASYAWSKDSIRLINTPDPVMQKTFFYVQETGYFKTSPPYFTERRNLDSFLIVYTLSGQGQLTYQGQTHLLTAGQAFFIHCMEHHYYECCRDSGWEILWLHFNGISSRGYYEEYKGGGTPAVILPDPAPFELLLRRILSLTQKRSSHSEIVIASLICQLLTELLVIRRQEGHQPDSMPVYLKQIRNALDKHFQEKLSLDNLARDYGISKYYLLRQFKKYMGTSIGEYLISLRLNHAKELLKYSDLSVTGIGSSCGIPNTSHFISLFKAREGKTPLQFRKEWT